MFASLDDVLATGRGTERAFNCPSEDHEDKHASASVNVVKGYWTCYSCHASGTLEGHVPDPKDALRALADLEQPARIMPERWLDLFDFHHGSDYWAGRFGSDIASHYRCGTHPESGFPTYPIRDLAGRLLGVVTRHKDGSPKYQYPWRARTSQTFFKADQTEGADYRAAVFVLVEGAADVMAIAADGIPEPWQVYGCFGSGLHAAQVEALADARPKLIVAAFDTDKAGRLATERALMQCSEIAPVLSDPWGSLFNDPADVPQGRRVPMINELLESAGYDRYIA
jgi:hypothetical protein